MLQNLPDSRVSGSRQFRYPHSSINQDKARVSSLLFLARHFTVFVIEAKYREYLACFIRYTCSGKKKLVTEVVVMIQKALAVKLVAKPGKEAEVEAFLNSGLALVNNEPLTVTWYAIKFNETT